MCDAHSRTARRDLKVALDVADWNTSHRAMFIDARRELKVALKVAD
jgi:hypothetical protein